MLEFVERIFAASGALRQLNAGETLIEQVRWPRLHTVVQFLPFAGRPEHNDTHYAQTC